MVNDTLCGEWLQACVYLPEDKLAQWTIGCWTSISSPPGYISGDSAQGTESGCERVSVLCIDLPGDAESKGALSEVT